MLFVQMIWAVYDVTNMHVNWEEPYVLAGGGLLKRPQCETEVNNRHHCGSALTVPTAPVALTGVQLP